MRKQILIVLMVLISLQVSAETGFEQFAESTVIVSSSDDIAGSGFVYQENYILTAYHVVGDSQDIEVVFNDGTTFEAESVKTNSSSDLALLELETFQTAEPLYLAEENIIDEDVAAIGYPYALDLSIAEGQIQENDTALNLYHEDSFFEDMIFTDAEIMPGHSGGPLVDREGQVHGVITARSGEGGYATSLKHLQNFTEDI